MNMSNHKFYGKILLFGEYTILKGSDALTVPHRDYFGELKFDRSKLNKMNSSNAKDLLSLSFYIKELVKEGKLSFNLDKFRNELEQGLYFSSNIPMGHGLGSSGALSAALYHRYVRPAEECVLSRKLQRELGLIESFYHKESSGLDPLLSFFGKPLLSNKGELDFVNVPAFEEFKELSFFLVDTEQSRQTDKLVDLFTHMDQTGEMNPTELNELILSNNRAIQLFLAKDEPGLFKEMIQISKRQLSLLNPMIPIEFAKIWRELLNSDQTILKICGAGGGGFLIGVTRNREHALKSLSSYNTSFMFND